MILAIDLGSTSFKAAVFDSELNRLSTGVCELTYTYGPGGMVELSPAHVLDSVRTVVADAVVPVSPDGLSCIAITSQGQTFTVVDPHLAPLMPFISWLDTRATDARNALVANPAFAEFARHVTFPVLIPALQLCQVRRLRSSQPALLALGNRILPLPSYVAAQLTGSAACDRNLAAMSGLYSMATGSWWAAALDVCGLCPCQLPALVDVGRAAGSTTAASTEWGLPAGIPVVLAGNDQTAGAYGVGVNVNDALLITLGTCQVAYRAPVEPPPVDRTTAAGPYPGDAWYAMAADTCGGNLITWARKVLSGCDTGPQFDAAAEMSAPGCHGLVFEVGCDVSDNCWRHLTAAHTPGDRARSIMEALVLRMKALVDDLTGGELPDTVFVAGGGSRSVLWTSLLADALGRRLVPTSADPLTGAARMARHVLDSSGSA